MAESFHLFSPNHDALQAAEVMNVETEKDPERLVF